MGESTSEATFLLPYPRFGIELECFLAKLEVEGAVTAAVVGNCAEDVAALNLLSFGDNGAGEVAIDGNVAAVAHKDIAGASKLEDAGDDSVEDGTGTGSRTAYIVRALVVQLHILHARHSIEAEATAHHILPRDGYGQTAFVLLEGTAQLAVFCREPGRALSASL